MYAEYNVVNIHDIAYCTRYHIRYTVCDVVYDIVYDIACDTKYASDPPRAYSACLAAAASRQRFKVSAPLSLDS